MNSLGLHSLSLTFCSPHFQVSPNAVHALCTSRQDTSPFILTAGSDRRIRLWDLAYPEHSQMVAGAATDNLNNVVLQYKYETILNSWIMSSRRPDAKLTQKQVYLLATIKSVHSNESYWAVLSRGTVYYAVQGGSSIFGCGIKPLVCDHSNESYWVVLSCCTLYYAVQGGSNFMPVDKTLVCGLSNESYWAVLSFGTLVLVMLWEVCKFYFF